jgi:hypothetical protein
MPTLISEYARLPRPVRRALIFLVAGWVLLLATIHFLLPGAEGFFNRILIAGAITCFLVLQGYPWARMICLMANAMVIVYFLFIAILFGNEPLVFAAAASVVVLFALSSGYFWSRETAAFFRRFRNPESGDNG